MPKKRKGEWVRVKTPKTFYGAVWECSACQNEYVLGAKEKPPELCPNCGAEMREHDRT